MAKQTGARRGRRPQLSREAVLGAALELANESGIAALTMRDLAQRVGAEAMSLYRHVRNKDDLLDGMVDLVFSDIEVPPAGTAWREAMRRRAISAREVLARHPWAIGLMESRAAPGPANLAHHDAVLGILRSAGFSSVTATRAYNLVNSYVYGFALQERSLPVATPETLAEVGPRLLGQLDVGRYPHLAAVGADLMRARFDYASEFETGLDLILDALESLRRKKRT